MKSSMAPYDVYNVSDNPELNGTSGHFLSVYSNLAEKLNEITKLLGHCGIERVVPTLLKIAVIRNQSIGKSSLIEAILKIKVFPSKGTTTKSLMEVILRSSQTEG